VLKTQLISSVFECLSPEVLRHIASRPPIFQENEVFLHKNVTSIRINLIPFNDKKKLSKFPDLSHSMLKATKDTA
jgi:hypothetical protein